MARLCKIEELYNFKCKDYLLWIEKHKWVGKGTVLFPCPIQSPVTEIYTSTTSNPEYIYVGGWEKIKTYNKEWRI